MQVVGGIARVFPWLRISRSDEYSFTTLRRGSRQASVSAHVFNLQEYNAYLWGMVYDTRYYHDSLSPARPRPRQQSKATHENTKLSESKRREYMAEGWLVYMNRLKVQA